MFTLYFEILTTTAPSIIFFVVVKMMPEASIYHLIAIFRAFLLMIGHKQKICMIALTKSGIKTKCFDSLKPLCEFLAAFLDTLCTLL